MGRNEVLHKKAVDSVNELNADTSVPHSVLLDQLENLRDEIEAMIQCLQDAVAD